MPQGMDSRNTILLVEKYPYSDSYNEKMDAYLAKKYLGKYVILSRDAILNKTGKYADTKIYHYALLWNEFNVDVTSTVGANSTFHNLTIDCHYLDRMDDREYPKTGRTYIYAIYI